MTSPPRRAISTAAPGAEPSSRARVAPAARGRPRDPEADASILAATFRQLVESGYAGLSIESVAAEAGVAKTTIYRRWPTKRDLVVAALATETPFEPPPVGLDAHTAIELLVRGAIATLIESGAVRILGSLLVEDQREPGLLVAFRERILGPRRGMVEAMLREGIARGEVRPDIEPLLVTEMIAGAVFAHHVMLGMQANDAWVETLVDHVWTAIRARA